MKPEEELNDLAAAHALGALSADEAARVERAAATDSELAAELAGYREVVAELAHAVPPVEPPAELREQVMARVPNVPAAPEVAAAPLESWEPSPRRVGVLVPFMLVGCLLVAAVASWLTVQARRDVAGARAQVSALQIQRDSVAARLQYREATLNEILLPGTTVSEVSAAGTVGPVLQVFWIRAKGQWLVHATGLQPAAAGRSYQLWYMVNGKPLSARVFNTDLDGHTFFQLDLPSEAQNVTQVAVTVEPEGGSPQPTSEPFMSGAVAG